jgi:hypothetical protein
MNQIADLHQRLLDAAESLTEMAVDQYDREERTRLLGKVEGVNLAISFLSELKEIR